MFTGKLRNVKEMHIFAPFGCSIWNVFDTYKGYGQGSVLIHRW
jgi:hypothetical protein